MRVANIEHRKSVAYISEPQGQKPPQEVLPFLDRESTKKLIEKIAKYRTGANRHEFFKRKYERICQKHGIDLGLWIKENAKSLPIGDWGRYVNYQYRGTKKDKEKFDKYTAKFQKLWAESENQ